MGPVIGGGVLVAAGVLLVVFRERAHLDLDRDLAGNRATRLLIAGWILSRQPDRGRCPMADPFEGTRGFVSPTGSR